jgi:enamine deaminase RidA (YjgF/YER057c/UK114 family)
MSLFRHHRTTNHHRVVAHNDTLYVAGITAEDCTVGLGGQTAQILARIEALLAEHGSDKTKVLSATVYVTDLQSKPEMDAVWVGFFTPGHLPARATIGISDLGRNILIEVAVIASL